MPAKRKMGRGTAADILISHPNRDVAVFRLDHLGDAVMSSGLLAALRSHLPESFITVFSSEVSFDYLSACPYVNRVVAMPPTADRDHPQAQMLLREFREKFAGAFDIAINPRSSPDWFCTAPFVGATGAPVRIGFRQSELIGGLDANGYYTSLVDQPAEQEHPTLLTNRLLNHLGIGAKRFDPEVWFGRRACSIADSLLPPGRWIAVGLGASHERKIWPPEKYAIVANAMHERGYRSVLLGTARERTLADKIMCSSGAGHTLDLTGKTTIEVMAAVIERCVAFVGNDSGPKHVAAALGISVADVGYISDDVPGFEYERHCRALGVKSVRILPQGPQSVEATLSGAAIETIQADAVIAALVSLLEA